MVEKITIILKEFVWCRTYKRSLWGNQNYHAGCLHLHPFDHCTHENGCHSCQDKNKCLASSEGKVLGRKKLNINVENICNAICTHSTAREAAVSLGCSRAYMNVVLKKHGLTLTSVRKILD